MEQIADPVALLAELGKANQQLRAVLPTASGELVRLIGDALQSQDEMLSDPYRELLVATSAEAAGLSDLLAFRADWADWARANLETCRRLLAAYDAEVAAGETYRPQAQTA